MEKNQNGSAPATAFKLPSGEALLKMPYAELQDILQNHSADYEGIHKGFVRLAERAKKTAKELTGSVSFHSKLVCLELRAWTEGKVAKILQTDSFSDHYTRKYGKLPDRAYSGAKVFDCFVLAPEKAPRGITETVYDELTTRLIIAASKIVNIASGIVGATPETSGLNHQVFADVAAVLKSHGKNANAQMDEITDRLVMVESKDGDDTKENLVYLSSEELKARNAALAAQDQNGEIYAILKAGGLTTILAVLAIQSKQTHDANEAAELVAFGTRIVAEVAANETDGKDGAKVARFETKDILEWVGLGLPETMTDADAKIQHLAASHLIALLEDGFAVSEPSPAEQPEAETLATEEVGS